MGSKLRGLAQWTVAPAKNVETALSPKVNVLRGLAARATTPLLPDDYLRLLNLLGRRESCAAWSFTSSQKRQTLRLCKSSRGGVFP